jgi:hypothetical protein
MWGWTIASQKTIILSDDWTLVKTAAEVEFFGRDSARYLQNYREAKIL